MTDLVSRSTFAYAAVMFAVLFAPLAGKDPNGPDAHTLGILPDAFTLVALGAAVLACVWQALRNRPAGEPRFRRGFWFASIASAFAGLLDGIAVAGLGPTFVRDPGVVAASAAGSAVVVWLTGSTFAALFAFVLTRAGHAPGPRHGVTT